LLLAGRLVEQLAGQMSGIRLLTRLQQLAGQVGGIGGS
jgi:hypothetical protein